MGPTLVGLTFRRSRILKGLSDFEGADASRPAFSSPRSPAMSKAGASEAARAAEVERWKLIIPMIRLVPGADVDRDAAPRSRGPTSVRPFQSILYSHQRFARADLFVGLRSK
jgi:hypothetical protein